MGNSLDLVRLTPLMGRTLGRPEIVIGLITENILKEEGLWIGMLF